MREQRGEMVHLQRKSESWDGREKSSTEERIILIISNCSETARYPTTVREKENIYIYRNVMFLFDTLWIFSVSLSFHEKSFNRDAGPRTARKNLHLFFLRAPLSRNFYYFPLGQRHPHLFSPSWFIFLR